MFYSVVNSILRSNKQLIIGIIGIIGSKFKNTSNEDKIILPLLNIS